MKRLFCSFTATAFRRFTVDPSKLATAFQLMSEDEVLVHPLSRSHHQRYLQQALSITELLTISDPVLFMVTEALSKVYYQRLAPFQPCLIATTNPNPFEESSGPEAYPVLKTPGQLSGWQPSVSRFLPIRGPGSREQV